MKMFLVSVIYEQPEGTQSARAALVEAETANKAQWKVLKELPSDTMNWIFKTEELTASVVAAIKRCYP